MADPEEPTPRPAQPPIEPTTPIQPDREKRSEPETPIPTGEMESE